MKILLALFSGLLSVSILLAQPQIAISPNSLEFELFQYQTAADSFTISNTGNENLVFVIREQLVGDPVNILAWIKYTDLSVEWVNTVSALDMYLTGYTLDTTSVTGLGELAEMLSGRTCFLIPEQESASGLFELGQEWAGVLGAFARNGGIIVVLDINESYQLLYGAGLLDILWWNSYSDPQDVTILDLNHPFCQNVRPGFQVLIESNIHSSITGTCLVENDGYNNLTYREIHSGMVAYWGVDFYQFNPDMAQLLCNMVSWNGGIPWATINPVSGSIPPGGSQAVAVNVDPAMTPPGQYSGLLDIFWNGGDSLETVDLDLTVLDPLPASISVSPDSFNVSLLMNATQQSSLTITNSGPGFGYYNASFIPDFEAIYMDKGRYQGFEIVPAISTSGIERQNISGQLPPPTDDIYSGSYMLFGITNTYGEVMPFQCPIGIEHLYVGSYISGYTLSYYLHGSECLSYSVYENRTGMEEVIYEELPAGAGLIRVKTTNQTTNNALRYEQLFTFDLNYKFLGLEVTITNISGSWIEGLYYKVSADWDVDNYYDDDDWSYDPFRNMPFAFTQNYCSICPCNPQPDIIEYDGWDDYDRRLTDGNCPPGNYRDFDGLELLHYELGDLYPGQQAYVSVLYASGSSLADLQQQVDTGKNYIVGGPWAGLSHASGHLGPGRSGTVDVFLSAHNLIPDVCQGTIFVNSNDPINPVIQVPMALTVNTLNLMVSAEPLNPPVQIPVSGGQFQFYLEVTNTHTQGINTDIWSSVVVADTAEHFKGFTFENFYLGPEASLDTTITVIAHPGLIPGNYTYKVNTGSKIPRYVCASDSFPITVVGDELSGGGMEGALLAFKIGKPHPNPFNEVTSVEFTLDQVMPVSVKVYNLLGQQIAVVLDDVLAPGAYNYKWNAEGFSSGIYYMCLRAGEVSRNYKVLLMK